MGAPGSWRMKARDLNTLPGIRYDNHLASNLHSLMLDDIAHYWICKHLLCRSHNELSVASSQGACDRKGNNRKWGDRYLMLVQFLRFLPPPTE